MKYTESPSRGTWGSPWSPFIALPSFLKDATYHDNMEQADSVPRAVVGTKVPAASCGFTGSHSRGGRHGQAYPRIVAAYLHGRVRRRRHVRRNAAPLKAAVARHRRAGVGPPCWRQPGKHSRSWRSHLGWARPDCVAGHVRFELRNVVANYPFESARGFPGSEPNSGHGDHSRLSCSAGDAQLGTGFYRGSSASVSARALAIMRRRREGTNWPRSLSFRR